MNTEINTYILTYLHSTHIYSQIRAITYSRTRKRTHKLSRHTLAYLQTYSQNEQRHTRVFTDVLTITYSQNEQTHARVFTDVLHKKTKHMHESSQARNRAQAEKQLTPAYAHGCASDKNRHPSSGYLEYRLSLSNRGSEGIPSAVLALRLTTHA